MRRRPVNVSVDGATQPTEELLFFRGSAGRAKRFQRPKRPRFLICPQRNGQEPLPSSSLSRARLALKGVTRRLAATARVCSLLSFSDPNFRRRLSRRLFRSSFERRTAAASIFILLVAAIFRFVRLGSLPPPLADEILAAVDLRSALQTGRHFTGDELGILGLVTPALDGRYLIAALTGTTVPDLRLASALFGLATVAGLFLLARELRASHLFALFAAGFLALMPWHIIQSRIFLPAAESVFLTTVSLLLIFMALRKRSLPLGIAATLTAGISMYLYPVALFTSPLFLATAIIFRKADLRRFGLARAAGLLLVGLVIMTPYVAGHLREDSLTREINDVFASKMVWAHGLDSLQLMRAVGMHWLSYLTPDFLAFHGDPNPRQSVQSVGQVGWVFTTLGFLGVVVGVGRRNRSDVLFLSWLAVYPLGDALTYYDATGNAVRAPLGVIVWSLLAASGVDFLVRLSRRMRRALAMGILTLLTLTVVAQIALFGNAYFGRYPTDYGYAFETGYAGIYDMLKRRGVEKVPVTVHAGYKRDAVLRYFSNYRLRVVEVHLACYELPYDVVHHTVLPRVFVIREDRDFASVPGCIKDGLLDRDLNDLQRGGVNVEVLARFHNASSSRFETAIVFVQRARHLLRLKKGGKGAALHEGLRSTGASRCQRFASHENTLLASASRPLEPSRACSTRPRG